MVGPDLNVFFRAPIMADNIFIDRRKDIERRNALMPYGVRNCRRIASDRRTTLAESLASDWWLHVNYSVAEKSESK